MKTLKYFSILSLTVVGTLYGAPATWATPILDHSTASKQHYAHSDASSMHTIAKNGVDRLDRLDGLENKYAFRRGHDVVAQIGYDNPPSASTSFSPPASVTETSPEVTSPPETTSPKIASVPEPTSLALIGLGLVALGLTRRRQHN